MGLDYSYLLYFKREHLWDALLGVKDIAWEHDTPARIQFPDQVMLIPYDFSPVKGKRFTSDDPEFDFDTILKFDWDEAIINYLQESNTEDGQRSPPDFDKSDHADIGTIYLYVYQEDAYQSMPDLVQFKFTAATTRMSILFDDSASICRTFTGLLEKYNGICGVLDRESGGGRLFWFRGKSYDLDVNDAYLTMDEIEVLLKNQKQRYEND